MSVSDPGGKTVRGVDSEPRKNEQVPSSGKKGILDLPVHTLHQTFALRVVGCSQPCWMPSRMQVEVHTTEVNRVPHSVVTVGWNAKSCNPVGK
jgi:hypothetical protein